MPDMQFSAFDIAKVFYMGIVFVALVPRYFLCPLIRRRRYQALIGALFGIFVANFAILALLLHGKLGLAYFQTFGGLLVSIWVSLLQCRIDRTNAGKPAPREGQSNGHATGAVHEAEKTGKSR